MTRRPPLAELNGTDALAEIMSGLRLQGRVLCRLELSRHWAFSMPTDGLARFHVIEKGTCWVGSREEGRRQLAAGDLLVGFGEHSLSDRADPRTIVPIERFLGSLEPSRSGASVCTVNGGSDVDMLCGAFTFGHGYDHPLLTSLPRLLHVPGHCGQSPEWLELTLRFLSAEVRTPGIGSEAVLTRLIDLIFVQAVRAWVAEQSDSRTGWIGALRDRQLTAVLTLMHTQLDHPWTVQTLAREVGMSRSSLARRFRAVFGETPLEYLSRSRLQAAALLIRTESLSLSQVAARVGYQSEASFSRVFRQTIGKPPGAYRRAARGKAGRSSRIPISKPIENGTTECT